MVSSVCAANRPTNESKIKEVLGDFGLDKVSQIGWELGLNGLYMCTLDAGPYPTRTMACLSSFIDSFGDTTILD